MTNTWLQKAMEKAAIDIKKKALYLPRIAGTNTLSMRIYNAGANLAQRITSKDAEVREDAIAGMEKALAEAKEFHGEPIDLRKHFCPAWYKDPAFYLTITVGAGLGIAALVGMTYAIKYFMGV